MPICRAAETRHGGAYLGGLSRLEDDAGIMTSQASSPSRLAKLIEQGDALTGFPWPDRICETEMRIGRDGTWYHKGAVIERKRLCQLFATVLQQDEKGDYWLVTPVEKGRIDVDDMPFLAVELQVSGNGAQQVLEFRTNLDHWVTAGPDHPIRVVTNPQTGEPAPYLLFRDNLEARINRPVFYELAELAEERDVGGVPTFGVSSRGVFFEIGTAV